MTFALTLLIVAMWVKTLLDIALTSFNDPSPRSSS